MGQLCAHCGHYGNKISFTPSSKPDISRSAFANNTTQVKQSAIAS
jgi:hypothetical protein